MAITFNKLIRPNLADIRQLTLVESHLRFKSAADVMMFLSHKTGDDTAETVARYISDKHHVQVYMAEWDDTVYGDSAGLPDHIMSAIQLSNGFLLNVIPEIGSSMWIGYEIGGAHALDIPRAKFMAERVTGLPSVVGALRSLRNRSDLDQWVASICRWGINRTVDS